MATREQGMRRTAAVTSAVAAAAVLGSVGVAVAAYAHDQSAAGASSSTSGSVSSVYPSVTDGSGSVAADAHSGGS